ncbi:MAG TPA: ABC transporter permease [Bryobacterales bacterium]|nr:ABC transporter permease [Bryobacterales bacterium]
MTAPAADPRRQSGPRSRTRARSTFSGRLWAMIIKEFIQLRRDRLTLAMIVIIPLMELLVFGYAINMTPKHLPLAVLAADDSDLARDFVAAVRQTGYFDIRAEVTTEARAERLIRSGRVIAVLQIPPGFGREVRRGARPQILLVTDATDPVTTSGAVAAVSALATRVFARALRGPHGDLAARPPPFELIVQKRYNPAGRTAINIVPGLIGVILTMTMLVFTGLAVTREVERGTMEALLATPLRPVEIMLGKIAPYIIVGFVQLAIIMTAGRVLFGVPLFGPLTVLLAFTLVFIAANLSMGYTISTIAGNQLQAVQMSFFFFLPSILMSGFMFPFHGMPLWARIIGEMLPLTHFLRIVRGIMLKGAGFADLAREGFALFVFMLAVMIIATLRFRRTLD